MKGLRKKSLVTVVIVILVTLLLASSVLAKNVDKMLQAYYRNIKILHNGQLVNIAEDIEPFIVNINNDPTTFVPLRALGEILGKDVVWDGSNYTVNIADRPNQDLSNLLIQVTLKEEEIKKLKDQVAELEKKLEEKEKEPSTSKSELEKQLNKDYGYYKGVDLHISLTINSRQDDIKVEISLDDRYYNDRYYDDRYYDDRYYDYNYGWSSLSSSERQSLIKSVVKDIQKYHKNAYIHGYIEERYYGYELASFYTNNSGSPVITIGRDYNPGWDDRWNLSDLEYNLNNRFGWYDVNYKVSLSTSGSSLYVNLDVNESDWRYLGYTSQERMLEDMYSTISQYYLYDVYGSIYYYGSSGVQHTFDYNSRGDVTIR